MGKIKRGVLALVRFWQRHRISTVLFIVLVIGVIIAGLHDVGIVMGILAGMVIMIDLSHRWRRIRNFVFLFLTSFFGIIFLSFLDEGVVKPIVSFLAGSGAVNGTGFELFNQIISLAILFFGTAGLITGFFGVFILGVFRLVVWRNTRRTEADT
jgi:hypothetical protein